MYEDDDDDIDIEEYASLTTHTLPCASCGRRVTVSENQLQFSSGGNLGRRCSRCADAGFRYERTG